MAVNYVAKAQKQVEKAVGVFAKAIIEVEHAQETLLKGIEEDSYTEGALRNQIIKLKVEMEEVAEKKREKGLAVKKNQELLQNLNQFKTI